MQIVNICRSYKSKVYGKAEETINGFTSHNYFDFLAQLKFVAL